MKLFCYIFYNMIWARRRVIKTLFLTTFGLDYLIVTETTEILGYLDGLASLFPDQVIATDFLTESQGYTSKGK